MILKILIFANVVALGLSACVSEQPMGPEAAQITVRRTWQANQHIVWEIEWPAVPIGGPLTVETWRADGRYRFEILESTAPALVGQTLIFDGQNAWRYNRFDPEGPISPSSPVLSPVSDAFAIIDRLIAAPPATATHQESRQLNHGPTRKIGLTFENNDSLIFWLDQETGLPARILFSVKGRQATLQARSLEPLPDPPEGLFEPSANGE